MKNKILILIIFLIGYTSLAQKSEKQKQDPRDIFVEAESYLLYEEYEEALPLYLRIVKEDPTNANLNFKVGLCYLNIPYEKERSITYLEKAIEDITVDYKMNSFKERKAPLDALFYLGNAYRINNQLDKALKYYQEFKKRLDPNIYDEEIVNEQIQTVERAKRYFSKPIFYVAKNVGEPINSRYAEKNAVVSGNENVMAYNVKLPFYEALYVSRKINGKWQPPINIIPELGVDGDVRPTGLSFDGNEMIIYRNDNYDGNLYVSRFVNNKWTPIKRLNDKINTKYWESHGSLSPDGYTLYFTSNRKGGFGGLDIYTATRSSLNSDDWGNIKNLGPDINTRHNDESPFLSQDGKVLYFSSYGHFNMGGYDVFYSTFLENGRWSAPLNMGYPLNTTDDDTYFVPVDNGNFAYITRYYADSYGRTDIYKVELFSEQHPRKFILRGLLSLPAKLDNRAKLYASIINKTNKDTVLKFLVNAFDSSFDTIITAGTYQLVVQGENIEKHIQDFNIDKNQNNSEIDLKIALKEKIEETIPATPTPSKSDEPITLPITFKKNFYKVFNDKNITIELPFAKGTVVKIDILLDSQLIARETFITTKDFATYNYIPRQGLNLLQFTVNENATTTHKGEIIIIYESISDSIPPTELAKELERRKNEVQYYKVMLQQFVITNDSLKRCIRQIDIDENNLISINDLMYYLKYQIKCYQNHPSEVDSLIKLLFQHQNLATSYLLEALSNISSDSLKIVVDSLQKDKKIRTITELAKILNEKAYNNKEFQKQLITSSTRLGCKSDAYYYSLAMRNIANLAIKTALDSAIFAHDDIVTSHDLLNYLIDNAKKFGYQPDEIYYTFFALPLFTTSSVELIEAMKIHAHDKTIKELLEHLNLKNIRSARALAKDLFNEASKRKINPIDLTHLLIIANDSVAFDNYMANLILFSRGEMKDILLKINLKEENLNSPSDIWNYLFNNNLITPEQWVTLNLYIASKNLIEIKEWIRLKKHPIISPLDFSLSLVFILIFILILVFAFKKLQEK